jgi:hypothetical protein
MDQLNLLLAGLGPWGYLIGALLPYLIARLGIKVPNPNPVPVPPVQPAPVLPDLNSGRPLLDWVLKRLSRKMLAGEKLDDDERAMFETVLK